MRYARSQDGRVAEIISLPDGVDPATAFHAALSACIRPCPDIAVCEGWMDDGVAFSPPVDDLPPLEEARALMLARAAAALEHRVATGAVSVTTSAGTHTYGIDRGTQDNLMKATLGIVLGTTPSPRPWTPKGALAPVSVTHADLTAIAAAVGGAYDARVQAYLVHKAAIAGAATAAAVMARDLTQGWPG